MPIDIEKKVKIDFYWDKNQPACMPSSVREAMLKRPSMVYYVPTEFVVDRPQVVTPIQARAWAIWQTNDNTLPWVPRNVGEVSKGGFQRGHAYVVEVYVDCGSDGHTSYVLDGYTVLTSEQWREFVDPVSGAMTGWIDAFDALQRRT